MVLRSKLHWRNLSTLPELRLRFAERRPNSAVSILAALKECRSLQAGKKLHLDAVDAGCYGNRYVANALITMYSRCGSMKDAREVFEKLPYKDTAVWNSLILGYGENGERSVALDLFTRMDCEPSSFTFVAALKACSNLEEEKEAQKLQLGVAMHEQIKEHGHENNLVVANTLLNMYSRCGSMSRARDVFDNMPERSVVTWNSLMSSYAESKDMVAALDVFERMAQWNTVTWNSLMQGYVDNGNSSVALDLLRCMRCEPNSGTFVSALKACGALATTKETDRQTCLQQGMSIHKQVKELGYEFNLLVAGTLVDMYSKCGCIVSARGVFDRMPYRNVVSWNCMIHAYVENGESLVALDLFKSMDCEPSSVTFVAVLKACASLAYERPSEKQLWLHRGVEIHNQVKDRGLERNLVLSSMLVDMYCKCGNMQMARDVFDKMTSRSVVTWNCLISGYVENAKTSKALEVFASMEFAPDAFTFATALKACGGLADLEVGRAIHAHVCMSGLEQDAMVATSLVDLYGRCGKVAVAEHVFDGMQSQDIVSWTALIAGYTAAGETSRVFSLANELGEAGLQMNDVAFTCILSACSHAGMVDEAKRYFDAMARHGASPSIEHYTCMVDMLGRANRLEEALLLVKTMPFQANNVTWKALLASCRKWNNLEVGKLAFDALVGGNTIKEDSSPYVLMREVLANEESFKI